VKFIILGSLVCVFFFAAPPSHAQMMEHMKGHMEVSAEAEEAEKDFTKEAEAGGVTVKVIYKNPSEKGPVFSVTLDTHSIDVDRYRLDEITILRDGAGNVYRASLISSSGGGHHREAVLEFRNVDISSLSFAELIIKGVGGVEERVFRFELQENP